MALRISARAFLDDAARELGRDPGEIAAMFGDAPLDFDVVIASRLPLFAHRNHAIGITLRGTVRFLDRTLTMPPIERLTLLRHEAEHVRQQRRRPVLFYPIYVADWLVHLVNPFPGEELRRLRKRFGRGRGAYRAIADEIAAYGAGERFAALLRAAVPGASCDAKRRV